MVKRVEVCNAVFAACISAELLVNRLYTQWNRRDSCNATQPRRVILSANGTNHLPKVTRSFICDAGIVFSVPCFTGYLDFLR
jgi:hypothetical protein